jgi:REP element-mobilizing transposase RayT
MTTGYQIRDQAALHYLTIQVVDWIDVFTRQVYCDMVIDSLKYYQDNKGLQLFGYVIMSNHVHLIANSPKGQLSDIFRDFKKFTARTIIENIGSGTESRKDWILNRFQFNAQRHSRNENTRCGPMRTMLWSFTRLHLLWKNWIICTIIRLGQDW